MGLECGVRLNNFELGSAVTPELCTIQAVSDCLAIPLSLSTIYSPLPGLLLHLIAFTVIWRKISKTTTLWKHYCVSCQHVMFCSVMCYIYMCIKQRRSCCTSSVGCHFSSTTPTYEVALSNIYFLLTVGAWTSHLAIAIFERARHWKFFLFVVYQ